MRRITPLFLAPAFLLFVSVLALILMLMVVNQIKSSRNGVVTLKPKPNASPELVPGEVTRSDKYVTVAVNGTERVYGWDQIENISFTQEGPLQKLDRVVDLLDLLSKLGIGLTVVFFMVGLHQYGQAQKWEREKFLATAVKEFDDLQTAHNAKQMLDSLTLYRDGRQIEFNPKADRLEDRKTFVSNEKIIASLTTAPHDELARDDEIAFAIRDCFDTFLSYMVTFDHFIEQDLITKDALMSHLGYWITLLGPEGKLDQNYKKRILDYAQYYELDGAASLVERYQQQSRWDRILNWFIR